jgi:hypothetical protein
MPEAVRFVVAIALWGVGCGAPSSSETAARAGELSRKGLKTARAFDGINDPVERSLALFAEANKVLSHPRCVNCHPGDGRPRQGEEHRLHVPVMFAGPDGHGPAAQPCKSCHQTENFTTGAVPGAPKWALAPDSMAWLGRSPGEICRRLKDPNTNGHKSLAQIVEHVGHDELVAWGWAPGGSRAPAPGDPETAAGLLRAWADTGAHCPPEAEIERQAQ